MGTKKNSNPEDIVKCPVEGCDHEGLSRGMHLHIRQSSGNGHGPHGDVPEHLDLSTLEKVGEQDVDIDYPETREIENVARLCPYCGRAFRGYQGVKIHLGQKKGQGVHPEDANETEKSETPIAHVDEDMNVIELVEEGAMMPSTKRRIEDEDSIKQEDVVDLIDEFEEEGNEDVADRIRAKLL